MSSQKPDLRELAALLGDVGLMLPVPTDQLRVVVPWAVEFRYEDVLEERIDRIVARATVAQVRVWVDGLLTRGGDAREEAVDSDEPPAG